MQADGETFVAIVNRFYLARPIKTYKGWVDVYRKTYDKKGDPGAEMIFDFFKEVMFVDQTSSFVPKSAKQFTQFIKLFSKSWVKYR
jgi:hypothetical protein